MNRPFRSAPDAKQTAAKGELVALKSFDYTVLDANVVEQVQTAAQRIRQLVQRTLKDVIAVGNNLLAVKAMLPHGSFGPWLRTEFGWTERTARNFMAVARRIGAKTEIISDLQIDPTAAYVLSAPSVPEEAIATALQRAEKGERITVSVAGEILSSFRRKPVHRERASSAEWPAGKLRGELLETLESFRRRYEPQQLAVLAQQLRDFADSLVEK
jgi:hypothetical protein